MHPERLGRLDEFNRIAQEALFFFQVIEEALKAYLAEAHEIIRLSVPTGLAYKVDSNAYLNAPLERLLLQFAVFCQDRDLITSLNQLREGRNYCAHRAFAHAAHRLLAEKQDIDEQAAKVLEYGKQASKAYFALLSALLVISKLRESVQAKAVGPKPATGEA